MAGILRVDQANVDYIYAKTAGGKVYIPGHIIQVQQTIKTDTWSAAPGAGLYAAVTGLSVAITPTYATSKIFVMLNMWIGTTTYLFKGLVKRNGTIVARGDDYSGRPRASFAGGPYAGGSEQYSMSQVAFNYLDSPATTSSCTYTVEAANYTTNTVYVNRNHVWQVLAGDYDGVPVSTITAMEIAH